MAKRIRTAQPIPMELGIDYDISALCHEEFSSANHNPLPANHIKVASIFSGCGGLDLGFKWAGFDLSYANEIDSEAAKTYEENLGHAPVCQDINTVDIEGIVDHDILIGGFPCQPFSMAGKRLGFEDARGTLFFHLASILQHKSPKAFLFENVPGLIDHLRR